MHKIKKWVLKEELFLKKYYNKGINFCANKLNRTNQSILKKANRMNLKVRVDLLCKRCKKRITKHSTSGFCSKCINKINLKKKPIKINNSVKFPDFRIGRLIIECDGSYWHKDKNKEKIRDSLLLSNGYIILHFSEKTIKKNIKKVEKCILKELQRLKQ